MNLPLLAASDDPLSHVVQHPLITKALEAGGLLAPKGEITVLSDQIVMMIASFLLLAIFVPLFVKRRKGSDEVGRLVPTGFGNFVEAVCQYLRDEVARPVLGEHTDRFIKYLWTAFFFILTMNLIGMLPVASTTRLFGLYLGGTPTANIYVTGALALMTLVLMVFNGLRLGGIDYIKHFTAGAPLWITPLIVPLEIIGTLARAAALALRLFIAIAGGHILLAVLVGLILKAGTALGTVGGLAVGVVVVLGSVAIGLVEVFVAFLQAFIFTYLSALFIGMSVNVKHDHEHAGPTEGAPAH